MCVFFSKYSFIAVSLCFIGFHHTSMMFIRNKMIRFLFLLTIISICHPILYLPDEVQILSFCTNNNLSLKPGVPMGPL